MSAALAQAVEGDVDAETRLAAERYAFLRLVAVVQISDEHGSVWLAQSPEGVDALVDAMRARRGGRAN